MMIYRGKYLAHDGRRIPYILGTLGLNKMVIKYDLEGEKLPAVHEIPIRYNGSVVWKCNTKSISCNSTSAMFRLFEQYPAYAGATFRYFTGIK
ncbi:MAG: hypothetical protein J6D57_14800 [Mogibacterium sp.]|nr:hypothetical protein [Mogibacterium sp.]